MPSIQKQISLIFNKKKQQIFVDYFTYQRIRTQVFNYPKKYQNNFTYYIDLDNNLYEILYEFLNYPHKHYTYKQFHNCKNIHFTTNLPRLNEP